MKSAKAFAPLATFIILVSMMGASPGGAQSGDVRQILLSGPGSLTTGDFVPSGSGDVTSAEFPGQMDSDAGPGPYPGSIVNRSLSNGTGNGVSVNSGKKVKSIPAFNIGFEGLN